MFLDVVYYFNSFILLSVVFPLLPLLSVYFVFRNFRNNDTDDTWLREQQEREENYRRKWNKFKKFHYPGKVSFDFDADTYIYVENRYDDSLNQCIRENLDEIKAIFVKTVFVLFICLSGNLILL